MSQTRYIVGLADSLSVKATSKLLLQYTASVSEVPIRIIDISNIPFYNKDVEDHGYPESVQALREQLRGSAAVLFSLSQNNSTVSGVLKNTIDWIARNTYSDSPLKRLKTGVITGGEEAYNFRFAGSMMPGLETVSRTQYYTPSPKKYPEPDTLDEYTKEAAKKYIAEFNRNL